MNKLLLILIIIIASFLRLYKLDQVPPSASLDEASIGWNAYSVLKTGVDEFNQFPIISQRGYDDYRRSTYLFLVIPSIFIFNLNAFAVRFPAAILSIFTVLAIYGIVKQLFSNDHKTTETLALLSALFLAISPWHIYISRLGHESNACLSFLVFGIYFFLKSKTHGKYLYASVLFLLLSMVSYYTGQIVIPLLVVLMLLMFYKHIYKVFNTNLTSRLSTLFLIFLSVMTFWSVFSPSAMIRYKGTSTLSPEAHLFDFPAWIKKRNLALEQKNLLGTIIYDRRVFFLKVLAEGYLSHFKTTFLLGNNSKEPFKIPHLGLIYYWQFPLTLIGIIYLFFYKKLAVRYKILLLFWFVIGPIPASIATQAPHAMRAFNMLPVWQIFSALGLIYLFNIFKKFKYILFICFGIFLIYNLNILYTNYFIELPLKQSKAYQLALVKTINYVVKNQQLFNKIVFSNEDNLYQSYMHFLFQSKFDPKLYSNLGGTKSGGYAEIHKFGKYEFRPINWQEENQENSLYIGNPKDFQNNFELLSEGKYLDGSIGVMVVRKINSN